MINLKKNSTLISGEKDIKVIFGARSFKDNLLDHYLSADKGNTLDTTLCLSRETVEGHYSGRVTDYLETADFPFPHMDFYVSGNPDMVQDTSACLREKGATRIFTELY